jgi:hypothetical protein
MRSLLLGAVCVVIAGWSATPLLAQKAPQTPSEFYLEYRAAYTKATAIEQLLPYMSKDGRAKVDATPKAQRPDMFKLLKAMDDITGVKVVKETKSGEDYELEVQGVDGQKKPAKGTAKIVKEGGAWKLDSENWSSSSD